MAVDPNATTLKPAGFAASLLAVNLFFAPTTTIVVLLRSWIRVKHSVFGVDDGLMVAGWMLFLMAVGAAVRSTYAGNGTKDELLNANMDRDAKMYIWYFQISYCCSVVFIKASICVTLLRIAVSRIHRVIVWATLVASCISTFIVIIGLFAMCRPIAANWDSNAGSCSPPSVLISLSYLVSAGAVATDCVCSILPGFMLYKAQMKLATKISISIILGLGILASIATMVRLPYIKYFAAGEDYLYYVGIITLWSVFESGTGIIAGSLPSLRRLLKNWINFDSTGGHSSNHMTPNGGTGRNVMPSASTGIPSRLHKGVVSNVTANRNWEPLDDAESSHKIYVKVDMEMQSLERPATSIRSHESTEHLGLPANSG
ncbi:hypothetical protein NM208_g8988 [Fusarium decemcellulare]|uniref:Uncharacterized protein n=2 Tax=Fusarium decemcellulare TaxID=57161 RepID=A0ACC1S3C6_9HYPO|nr:hypothetical protein NM208_g13240 [Fusarium decemcellulare]KAJ3531187.1 hypothetical protein NM208_g8988 [Fusarium decemcellulare]